MTVEKPRFEAEPSVNNHFAWARTQLGLQRTLMAAVRTAVSLIGFGFTVAQFFTHMQDMEGARVMNAELPRNMGLVLIAAGVLSLAIFTWQYRAASRYLSSEPFKAIAYTARRPMHASSYLTAFAVMLIGIAAFGSIFIHF
jgi:putative membrane protein